ncbi:hypothetical protein ACI65C_006998 [Semiaphis heraclei]
MRTTSVESILKRFVNTQWFWGEVTTQNSKSIPTEDGSASGVQMSTIDREATDELQLSRVSVLGIILSPIDDKTASSGWWIVRQSLSDNDV